MHKLFINKHRKSQASHSIRLISFNNSQRDKIASELQLANVELMFQNDEKELRANELLLAHENLLRLNNVVEKNYKDLEIANGALIFQINEKEKTEASLIEVNDDLRKAEVFHKEYIVGLEKIIYMISHEVRQPIAQVLGLADLLEKALQSTKSIKVLVNYMKKSATSLDGFTRDLTKYLGDLLKKGKYKFH